MAVISKAEERTEKFHSRGRRAERKTLLTTSAKQAEKIKRPRGRRKDHDKRQGPRQKARFKGHTADQAKTKRHEISKGNGKIKTRHEE
jgi:hypothetical protein